VIFCDLISKFDFAFASCVTLLARAFTNRLFRMKKTTGVNENNVDFKVFKE